MSNLKIPPYSECDLQAEFYHRAKLRGLRCRLEVGSCVGRLDVVVLAKGRTGIYLIVECKRSTKGLCPMQLSRYRGIGAPVLTLCGKKEINRLLDRIERQIVDLPVIPWLRVMPVGW